MELGLLLHKMPPNAYHSFIAMVLENRKEARVIPAFFNEANSLPKWVSRINYLEYFHSKFFSFHKSSHNISVKWLSPFYR